MARFLRKIDQKAGLPPGSLVFTGQQKVEYPQIRICSYDSESLKDEQVDSFVPEDISATGEKILWLNVDGVHDSSLIKAIGDSFRLSSLTLEDIQDTGQRPGIEDFQEYLFLTMKVFVLDEDEERLKSDQISIILGEQYLISFQEQPGIVFDPVRRRLRKQKGKIRQKGPDYLLYTLIDCVLENYLSVIEKLGERIEEMEEDVIDNPAAELLEEINFYRREIAYVRKSVRPVKDIISRLNKIDSDLVADETFPFLKDLSVMAEQALDSIEIYKEMLSDLFATYNMAIGTRLNETMKFLTVFATIFIPLTFLAGIYGMNFDVIPELHYKYSYFILLGIMLVLALAMLVYFKRKKWI